MSNSEEMRRIMNLMEAGTNTQEIDADFDTVESVLMRAVADTARAFKKQSSDKVTHNRAAPDTSKFIAPSYSMIEAKYNVRIHKGAFDRAYFAFLQLGSGLDVSVRKNAISFLEEEILEKLGMDIIQGSTFVTRDGVRVYYSKESGTAWGGAGFFKS